MAENTQIKPEILSDKHIIDMYWERNEQAISETDKKYGRFLFRIAYNIMHDRLDSEECKNDTYLGIWNSIPPNRPIVFSTFIAKIMRNTAIKKSRDKARLKRVPSELTVSMEELENELYVEDSPETVFSAEEVARAIDRYLDSLTKRQRYIFVGRFYMGDTLETIAMELKVNASTVYREAEKIKKGLKAYLEKEGIYV